MRGVMLAGAVALVVASGWVDGTWSNRWSRPRAMGAAVAGLERLPLELGPWVGQRETLDARQAETAELAGSALRKYVNRETGESAQVLLVCGHPGAIAVHTPDVCYKGAGYSPNGPIGRHERPAGPAGPAVFNVADMTRTEAGGAARLRIYWAWSDGGAWQAPRQPRLTFARRPVLYKLYVIRPTSSNPGPHDDDPCADLIARLLPEFERRVAPRTAAAPRAG
jgi:hypothetical protein